MLTVLKILAAELAEKAVRPRIDKAKADLKLAILTGTVLVVFSLLALLCLYLLLFVHLSEIMSPEKAALALFGFSVFMCLGVLLMYFIGRRVEQALYERKLGAPGRGLKNHLPDDEEIDIAAFVHDLFAENKGVALIAAAVAGIVMGAKPGMVLKGLGKIVAGKAAGSSRKRRRRRF